MRQKADFSTTITLKIVQNFQHHFALPPHGHQRSMVSLLKILEGGFSRRELGWGGVDGLSNLFVSPHLVHFPVRIFESVRPCVIYNSRLSIDQLKKKKILRFWPFGATISKFGVQLNFD